MKDNSALARIAVALERCVALLEAQAQGEADAAAQQEQLMEYCRRAAASGEAIAARQLEHIERCDQWHKMAAARAQGVPQ